MNLTLIPPDEMEVINKIMDDILTHESTKDVAHFKKKYNLTNEEYRMIFDLTMPMQRRLAYRSHNWTWRDRYVYLRNRILESVMANKTETADRVRKAVNDTDRKFFNKENDTENEEKEGDEEIG